MSNNFQAFEYLPALEFGITETCNLNCRSCFHNMPLSEDKNIITTEQFLNQVNYLKPFTNITNQIKLSGGEPLLNPNILDFCHILRTTWPQAPI